MMYMDLRKISRLLLDLNSEPENSFLSFDNQQRNSCRTADISFPIDLNSIPEISDSSQNQLTNSCLSIDLNSVPGSPSLLVDLNLVPENYRHSSENQQAESCFQLEVNKQLHKYHLKRKRPHDEVVPDDVIIAKRLRAAREKSRRDKLNNCFQELQNALDPRRQKSCKRIVLDNAIHALKDLTSELSRLRIEQAALYEESRELIQEKTELRLEKASLKSDIEILELQFQRSLSLVLPSAPTDPLGPIVPPAPSDPTPDHSSGLQTVSFLKDPTIEEAPSTSTSTSTSIVPTSYHPLQQNCESKGDEVENHGSIGTDLELMPGSISKKEGVEDGNFLNMPSAS